MEGSLEKVYLYGLMEIDMKESGICLSNMAKEQIILLMGIVTLVNTNMESQKDMEFIIGLMVVHMKDILKMVLRMEKENGKKCKMEVLNQVTSMREIIEMIKKTAKEYLFGEIKLFIKGNMLMI